LAPPNLGFAGDETVSCKRIGLWGLPPRVDHLDVVGRLTINEWKPRTHSAPLTREPGMAVAMGRVLVLTRPSFNDRFIKDCGGWRACQNL
jgi:hypothetical protein